jgi:hypothetical protein
LLYCSSKLIVSDLVINQSINMGQQINLCCVNHTHPYFRPDDICKQLGLFVGSGDY